MSGPSVLANPASPPAGDAFLHRGAQEATIEHADGTVSVKLDQEIVRVIGIKFTRGSRRSTYHFRDLGGSWRIWEIDEVAGP